MYLENALRSLEAFLHYLFSYVMLGRSLTVVLIEKKMPFPFQYFISGSTDSLVGVAVGVPKILLKSTLSSKILDLLPNVRLLNPASLWT